MWKGSVYDWWPCDFLCVCFIQLSQILCFIHVQLSPHVKFFTFKAYTVIRFRVSYMYSNHTVKWSCVLWSSHKVKWLHMCFKRVLVLCFIKLTHHAKWFVFYTIIIPCEIILCFIQLSHNVNGSVFKAFITQCEMALYFTQLSPNDNWLCLIYVITQWFCVWYML